MCVNVCKIRPLGFSFTPVRSLVELHMQRVVKGTLRHIKLLVKVFAGSGIKHVVTFQESTGVS